jgi:hypothetical protein
LKNKKVYLYFAILSILGISIIIYIIDFDSFKSNLIIPANAQKDIKNNNDVKNKTENDYIKDKLFGSNNTLTSTTGQYLNSCKLMCTHNDIISNQTGYYGYYNYNNHSEICQNRIYGSYNSLTNEGC